MWMSASSRGCVRTGSVWTPGGAIAVCVRRGSSSMPHTESAFVSNTHTHTQAHSPVLRNNADSRSELPESIWAQLVPEGGSPQNSLYWSLFELQPTEPLVLLSFTAPTLDAQMVCVKSEGSLLILTGITEKVEVCGVCCSLDAGSSNQPLITAWRLLFVSASCAFDDCVFRFKKL